MKVCLVFEHEIDWDYVWKIRLDTRKYNKTKSSILVLLWLRGENAPLVYYNTVLLL